jgi:toxin ParE1/3/4
MDELDEIAEYIARDSRSAAASVVARIRDASQDLATFPRMGRRVPEWDSDELRERIVYSYRVIYRIMPTQIEILSVFHGARMLPRTIRTRNI